MIPNSLKKIRKPVDLFQISFPRLKRREAIIFFLESLQQNNGASICFPDMSTINILESDPQIKNIIEEHFIPLNDGAGLQFASVLCKSPFPENLNGTDLIPEFLQNIDTTIYLIGSTQEVIQKTNNYFKVKYPSLKFIGSHSGFFDKNQEKKLIDDLKEKKPKIILVGMGNPKQLLFIQQAKEKSGLNNSLWFAVGGLFDFYGGTRVRAPKWMRLLHLEWLHIICVQPHKISRYLLGIPYFFMKAIYRRLTGSH